MYLEDIINTFVMTHTGNLYDHNIMASINQQIVSGSGLTEKQANLCQRILYKHRQRLATHFNYSVESFISNPIFKLPFRKNVISKTIVVEFDPIYGSSIIVSFPYNDELIGKVRKIKDNVKNSVWDSDKKQWRFATNEKSIKFLADFVKNEGFTCDDTFKKFMTQIDRVEATLENHVPLLTYNGTEYVLNNVSNIVPKIQAKTHIEAIFQARKLGIYTWDDSIEEIFNDNNIPPLLREFVKAKPDSIFNVTGENYKFSDINFIIQYLSPCLILIPGGSELEKLKEAHEWLLSLGILPEAMTVTFRLPSEINKNFNEYVKNHGLNSPINEKMKAVFVSGKLPKPIIKSKIKFHSIINLGFISVHYTIRNFGNAHQNFIIFQQKSENKELDFGRPL